MNTRYTYAKLLLQVGSLEDSDGGSMLVDAGRILKELLQQKFIHLDNSIDELLMEQKLTIASRDEFLRNINWRVSDLLQLVEAYLTGCFTVSWEDHLPLRSLTEAISQNGRSLTSAYERLVRSLPLRCKVANFASKKVLARLESAKSDLKLSCLDLTSFMTSSSSSRLVLGTRQNPNTSKRAAKRYRK